MNYWVKEHMHLKNLIENTKLPSESFFFNFLQWICINFCNQKKSITISEWKNTCYVWEGKKGFTVKRKHDLNIILYGHLRNNFWYTTYLFIFLIHHLKLFCINSSFPLFFLRKLSLSTNCIEKIANLNGLSKWSTVTDGSWTFSLLE